MLYYCITSFPFSYCQLWSFLVKLSQLVKLMFHQEHECLVEGPLNNLKQSMVQFQKPKKVFYFLTEMLDLKNNSNLLGIMCFDLLLLCRSIMIGGFSMVADLELCRMIILHHQAKVLTEEMLVPKVC